ncbi:phosphoribosylamine--glycine ligase [Candidatus Erwinia haradaeae]|uniref:Phosphoribosylamine--glycine ligase n=1 Tax=Candidatus Erwinia haradaeae TaxID=1922217 RepID=A0A451D8J1_9GAMM|nr:phosphoribosylamine--glycine ligase [Candidatus Erwinia haradaeae]VFP82137.1 Phosphoribosylamine--glycine ligase [Candidatus Erwinia haradaeae]
MKVLVIGNGGREHALAWKISHSKLVTSVFIAPGNAGTALESKMKNVAILSNDLRGLLLFALNEKIDLTVVGPETPLIYGIVDRFRKVGLRIFGPTQCASLLEGSKAFTKDFLVRHNIPTAEYQVFTNIESALAYLRNKGFPVVIKADGLASGKGVIIAMTMEEAESAIRGMLEGGLLQRVENKIVIEEFLYGEEVSFIVMVDGENVLPMATSQDHKRVGNGDTGLNTGGMGAYSPTKVVTNVVYNRIMDDIILPTIRGMAYDGNLYTGFLYAGLIIDNNSQPKVIEFNCRLGDPEAQVILLRLQSDLVELLLAAESGILHKTEAKWDPRPSLGLVLAANGYPGEYVKGDPIYGLSLLDKLDGKVFHSGTMLKDQFIVTNGGRVLCVTALGSDIISAQRHAYEISNLISWNGKFFRRDIGYHEVNRELLRIDKAV